MIQAGLFIAIDLLLFVVAIRRPWLALVALLALLPLNGFIVLVIGDLAGASGAGRVALAAWHDALAGGFIVAAAIEAVRALRRGTRVRPSLADWLVGLVLAIGIVYVIVAPHRLTALYAYRTLYEPLALFAAVGLLARLGRMPARVPRQVGVAILVGGLVAAVAVWPQVYVGGFAYLDHFFHDPGTRLSPSYIATAILQPRGVGTFTSPNEFGAYLSICLAICFAPGVVEIRPALRTWLVVIFSLALLLTFSRSGLLSTVVAVGTIIVVQRDRLAAIARARARSIRRPEALGHLGAVVVGGILVAFVVSSSGAPDFVGQTFEGNEPSAAFRPTSVSEGVSIIGASPLGAGLGMAGPKSVRFGEVGTAPALASEMWYLTYAMQVGVIGFAALASLLVVVLAGLWRRHPAPWPTLALGVWLGLGVGALFIPIVEDPSIATPMWVLGAVALAVEHARAEGRTLAMQRADGVGPAA